MSISSSNSGVGEDIQNSSEQAALIEARLIRSFNISRYRNRRQYPEYQDELCDGNVHGLFKLSKDRLLVSFENSLLEISTSGIVIRCVNDQGLKSIAASSTGTCVGENMHSLKLFSATAIDSSSNPCIFGGPGGFESKKIHAVALLDDYIILTSLDGSVMVKLLKGVPDKGKSQIMVESFKEEQETTENNRKRYISAVKENGIGVIYVSDKARLDTNQITKMSLEGEVLKVYNDWTFTAAGPIAATGDGHLFVCFPEQSVIQLLTEEMDEGITVLNKGNEIRSPTAMCYCSEEMKLYVCNAGSMDIMVFKIRY